MFYMDVFHIYGSMEIIKNEMRCSSTLAVRMSPPCAQVQLYPVTFTYADVCRDLVTGIKSSGLVTEILQAFCMSPISGIRGPTVK
jgi:hypothetical protein